MARNRQKATHQFLMELKNDIDNLTQGVLKRGGKYTDDEWEEFEGLEELKRETLVDAELEDNYFQRRIDSARAELALDPTRWPLDSSKRKLADFFALRSYLLTGDVPEKLRGLMVKMASQSADTDAGGGYTIPNTIANEVELALQSLGGMWEACRIVKTERGNSMPWPLVNDADEEGVLIAENTSMATASQAVTFGASQFDGFKFTSKVIEVSAELLEDSETFVPAFVEAISRRVYKITNRYFSTGSGSGQPHGLKNAATYGGSTADDQAIAYDDLIKLLHSIDPEYRNSGFRWMFHDSVLKHLRGLKEGTTNARLFPELNEGNLLGYPYVINNHLDSFTPGSASANDGKKVIYAGDFSKFVIRQVKDITIRRAMTTYGEKDTVAFAALIRCDSELIDAGTHPVKYLRSSAT